MDQQVAPLLESFGLVIQRLGPFPKMTLLPSPSYVVTGLSGSSNTIPGLLRLGIVPTGVQNDRHPIPLELLVRPIFPPGEVATTNYPLSWGVPPMTLRLHVSPTRDGTLEHR